MCGASGNPGIILLCAVVLCSAAVRPQDVQASSPRWDHDSTLMATSEGVTSDFFISSSSDPTAHDIVLSGAAAETRPSVRARVYDYPLYILEAFSFDPSTWTQSPAELQASEQLLMDAILSPSTLRGAMGRRSDATCLSSVPTAFDLLESAEVSAVVPVVGAVVLGMIWVGLVGWLGWRRAH